VIKALQGKKTYISSAALFLVAILGWWFGVVNGVQAAGMIAAAFGLAGLGARSTRYAELTLSALEEIKQLSASGKLTPQTVGAVVAKDALQAVTSTGDGAPK
jgi:hypothetical protein